MSATVISGIIGKTVFYEVLNESISSIMTYIESNLCSKSLRTIFEELDIQFTLELVQTFIKDHHHKRNDATIELGIKRIHETCQTIETTIKDMHRKTNMFNQSYSSYLFSLNLSSEKEHLTRLKQLLLYRFDLLIKLYHN